jgi:hypothetical protein
MTNVVLLITSADDGREMGVEMEQVGRPRHIARRMTLTEKLRHKAVEDGLDQGQEPGYRRKNYTQNGHQRAGCHYSARVPNATANVVQDSKCIVDTRFGSDQTKLCRQ